jgi:tRNA-specific 2-thiouridylase
MTDKPGVLVAMSGGVDSSVTAGLLQRAGYNCTGVFMCLGQAAKESGSHPGCCSPEDARDAQEIAARLGIEFHVLNFQKDLEMIVNYFVQEYKRARTPNPCIICNSRLKFGKLLEFAEMIDASYVATGHYARIMEVDGHKRLCRGIDYSKDQSYALFGMNKANLSRILLPLGEYTKSQVRHLAREMSLPVHDKGESQEICFVPDDDYARLVAQRMPELCKKGQVINTQGKVLGEHNGIFRYTIGQRKGLGIALGEPAYVVRLDAKTNTVVLGTREDLMQKHLWASQVNWLVEPIPAEPFAATIQIRYNHRGAAGIVTPLPNSDGIGNVRVDFNEPVPAITPGQAAVFYKDEYILGGGWIDQGE